jgi:hypothetical protein
MIFFFIGGSLRQYPETVPAHAPFARWTGSLRALDSGLRRKDPGGRALTGDEEIAANGDGLIAIAIALTSGHIRPFVLTLNVFPQGIPKQNWI